jgi:hypothetical protein
MSIIPAAVHICLRAEADDQPKGSSVVTPRVGVGLGRGTLNRHHRVNDTRTLWLVISFSMQADMNCYWNNRHGESSKTLTLRFYY